MTFGVALSGGLGLPGRAALDLGVEAIDAGCEPIFVTEVSGTSATAVAAGIAATRPGTTLGTGIVPLGTRTTAALAMDATTVASLAGVPFLLGVGVSTEQIVGDWHHGRRDPTLAATRQALGELRGLLSGARRGAFSLQGGDGIDVRILLGALGPRMVELGCTVGDGVILNLTPVDALPDLAGTQSFVYMWVRACEDADWRSRRDITSYAMARPYAQLFTALGYGTMVEQVGRLHAEGRLRAAPETIPTDLLDRLYVDVDHVPSRGEQYTAAGVTPILMPVTGARPKEEISHLLRRLR